MDSDNENEIDQLVPASNSSVSPGKSANKNDQNVRRGYRRSNLIKILPVILLGLGLLAGLVLVRYNADIRNLAFSGYQLYTSNLTGLKVDPNPSSAAVPESDISARKLFNSLSRTYFDAEVQNISEPNFGITGVAFLQYDQEINKTFVFSRIVGLPLIEGRLEQMWLVNQNLDYIPAGLGESYPEGDKFVTYNVFVHDGDIRAYKKIVYSFDSSLEAVAPQTPVLSIDF